MTKTEILHKKIDELSEETISILIEIVDRLENKTYRKKIFEWTDKERQELALQNFFYDEGERKEIKYSISDAVEVYR